MLSFQTIAELFKWTVVRNWRKPRVDELEGTLRQCIIVPYDRDMAWVWAGITGECQKRGHPISAGDAWIAAAAVRYDLPLLTNNHSDYLTAQAHCRLKLISA